VTLDNIHSLTAEPCCRVKGNYLCDPPICQTHLDEGWFMSSLPKGTPCADKLTRGPCGCAWGTLDQRKYITCATHAIGPLACCPRSQALDCVCAYAYSCPDHGTRHMGSHE